MKKILLTLVLLCPLAWGAPAIAHRASGTATPLTVTSTTSGNTFIAVTDTASSPASVQFNQGIATALTKIGACQVSNSLTKCAWIINSVSSGGTRISCTTCGSVNFIAAWEISGTDTTTPFDHFSPCVSATDGCPSQNGTVGTLTYHPGYSAEAIIGAFDCSASATSVTASGITLTTNLPNGNPVTDGIVSSTAAITEEPDSGCSDTGGLIFGIKGSGASQTCQWDYGYSDNSAQGSSATHPTVTAKVSTIGDLIVVNAWCLTTCGAGTITVGSDSATLQVSGASNASTGQPFIFYDVTTASGNQTTTFTPTGVWTADQVGYQQFIPSAGCTISHDVDAAAVTGSGATANTPTFTPTAGDVLEFFTASALHVTAVNSPLVCVDFTNGGTGDCSYTTTRNGVGFITSASGSSTANNMTQITGAWQAEGISFKLTGSGGGAVSRRRASVVSK